MKKQKKDEKALVARKRDYTVEINFSEEAIKNKLVRFTATRRSKSFVISLEEIMELIIQNLNKEYLGMSSIATSSMDFVDVVRTISGVCSKDFKEGDEISFNFTVKTPLEVAVAEELYNMGKINGDVVETVSTEKIKQAMKNIKDYQKEYVMRTHVDKFKDELEKLNTGETSESNVEEVAQQDDVGVSDVPTDIDENILPVESPYKLEDNN